VESGKMELEVSDFSLRESLDASLMMLREKALKNGITLKMELAPEADVRILADQRKLKQIMFNLLTNAVKFTPAGGTVDVNGERDGDFIKITVADTGLGIKKEDIPKLFQTFTQLESVYTKEYEGTGLGLALTRRLVELQGGRIWVKSLFGMGSRFSFTIPLAQSAGNVFLANRLTNAPGNGTTVLLIEDEPLTLDALEKALESNGYRVLRADDGEKGFEMALHEAPDLIVLDLIMPGMNGFDIADRLLSVNDAMKIPILVLTAMDLSAADRERLEGKVWRIAEKGSLSTQDLINLVESAKSADRGR
jgi:CheY-like chemotaxis protein